MTLYNNSGGSLEALRAIFSTFCREFVLDSLYAICYCTSPFVPVRGESLKCQRLEMALFEEVFTLVLEPFLLSSRWAISLVQLAIEDLPRESVIWHPEDMANPFEVAFCKCGLNAVRVGPFVNCII